MGTGSKNRGGAYVPPFFGGMYAPSGQGRRHAKLRHVCATREASEPVSRKGAKYAKLAKKKC